MFTRTSDGATQADSTYGLYPVDLRLTKRGPACQAKCNRPTSRMADSGVDSTKNLIGTSLHIFFPRSWREAFCWRRLVLGSAFICPYLWPESLSARFIG
jgi:hypothetical protein